MSYFNNYMMKGVNGILTNSHVCQMHKNFKPSASFKIPNNFSVSVNATGNASVRRTMKHSCPSTNMHHRSRSMGGY